MNTEKQLSGLILSIHTAVSYLRCQDFYNGQKYLSGLIHSVSDLLVKEAAYFSKETMLILTQYLQEILNAQENDDNILVADLLEMQLLPVINELLQQIISDGGDIPDMTYLEKNLALLENKKLADKIRKHVPLVKNSASYSVEITNLGVNTLKYNGSPHSFYYHSNANPVAEGDAIATYYIRPEYFNYTVVGFGFGYHIRGFLEADKRLQITAIETNLDVLTLAFMSCDLTDIIGSSRFQLEFCEPAELNTVSAQPDIQLYIHYPSLHALTEGSIKAALNKFFVGISSQYAQEKYLDYNYYYNMQLKDAPADTLKDNFNGKSVIYIGGGPSLEYYMDYVLAQQDRSDVIITCASTAYKKLLAQNIVPDYVFMIDPQDGMKAHIEGTPETTSELIYIITAGNKAVQCFQGKRFAAFQKGYPEGKAYADSKQLKTYECGGSVSIFAIELITGYGAKQLITIGLDLAYTDNKRHAGEAPVNTTITEHLLQVPGIVSKTVSTANNLNRYRLRIEKMLADVSGISLINLSRGAYIKGMKNIADVKDIN